MAWILPVLSIGASLLGQNAANKSAEKNNENQQNFELQQQQAAIANAQAARSWAQNLLSPFLQPGAGPFSNAMSQMGGRPLGPAAGPSFAQQVMNVGSNFLGPTHSAPSFLPGMRPLPPPQAPAPPPQSVWNWNPNAPAPAPVSPQPNQPTGIIPGPSDSDLPRHVMPIRRFAPGSLRE